MFSKDLNKSTLHVPKLFLNIDLLSFAKLLELLFISHSSSERSDIFVPHLLKLSHVLFVLQFTWVNSSPQLIG